jgi:hypothetical protein
MKQIIFLLTFFISANLLAEVQITGVVRSANATPIANASVYIFVSKYFAPIITTTTDKNGKYKIVLNDENINLQFGFTTRYVNINAKPTEIISWRVGIAAANYDTLIFPVVCFPNKNYIIDVDLSSAKIKSDNIALEKIFQYKDTISSLEEDRHIQVNNEIGDERYDSLKLIPIKKVETLFSNA